MEIRNALTEDSPTICQVLRRSIAELCVSDHGNNPKILGQWLSNKTPENIAAWIAQSNNSMLVVVEEDIILAVGCVTNDGEITLNYVAPEARFRGVSRALLSALETRATERGNTRCALTSNETARRFYLTAGYVDEIPSVDSLGYPMSKNLTLSPEAA
jgi:GNAT superfamily N-acetyltransferase